MPIVSRAIRHLIVSPSGGGALEAPIQLGEVTGEASIERVRSSAQLIASIALSTETFLVYVRRADRRKIALALL